MSATAAKCATSAALERVLATTSIWWSSAEARTQPSNCAPMRGSSTGAETVGNGGIGDGNFWR